MWGLELRRKMRQGARVMMVCDESEFLKGEIYISLGNIFGSFPHTFSNESKSLIDNILQFVSYFYVFFFCFY